MSIATPDYSHLSTQDLNRLIHDLSKESARAYHTGFLGELVRESEAMGLYAPPSSVEANTGDSDDEQFSEESA
jgi:hypothetical protein